MGNDQHGVTAAQARETPVLEKHARSPVMSLQSEGPWGGLDGHKNKTDQEEAGGGSTMRTVEGELHFVHMYGFTDSGACH